MSFKIQNSKGNKKGNETNCVYGQPFAFTAPKITESYLVDLTDNQKGLLPKIKVKLNLILLIICMLVIYTACSVVKKCKTLLPLGESIKFCPHHFVRHGRMKEHYLEELFPGLLPLGNKGYCTHNVCLSVCDQKIPCPFFEGEGSIFPLNPLKGFCTSHTCPVDLSLLGR